MFTLFAKAWEKFAKSVVLFYKTSDGILYYGKTGTTYTNPVSKAELGNLFKKGMIVIDTGDGFVRPTFFAEDTDYAYVGSVRADDSDKAVETLYYSDGYEG